MTVIGKHLYTDEMDERRRYRLAHCPRCGARTEDEAGRKCRPEQDLTGEYTCPGVEEGDPFGVKWDASGRACILTNESSRKVARALDAWVREMLERDRA